MFFDHWVDIIKELWTDKHLGSLNEHQEILKPISIEPFEDWLKLDLFPSENRSNFPKLFIDSYEFYLENVTNFGTVTAYQAMIQTHKIFVINVSTVGDDGWLEIFDENGQNFGAARTLLEKISWGEIHVIRSYLPAGFPSDLNRR